MQRISGQHTKSACYLPMTFRLRANSDQRRRRVLLEETRTEEGMPAPAPTRRTRRYPDDALRDAQPRVTDFLCSRWRQVVAIVATLMVIDLTLAVLAWFEPLWSARWPEVPLGAIAARYGDSLAGFCLSLQLAMATGLCALLFGVRRRRLDDLRGTYQVWIWATLLVGALFLIVATDVEDLLVLALQLIPRIPRLATAQAYLWVPLTAIYAPWMMRMLIEMRRSPAAQVALVLAGLLVVASEAVRLTSLTIETIRPISLGLAMISATLLCLALLSYGRYVKLDARGNFGEDGRRKKKRRKKKRTDIDDVEAELDEMEDRTGRRRIDPAHPLRGRGRVA